MKRWSARSSIVTLALLLVAFACTGENGAVRTSTATPAQTSESASFISELCDHHAKQNRASPGAWIAFRRFSESLPADRVAEYALDVLQNATLVPCWAMAGEAIGLVGDSTALRRLLEHFIGDWSGRVTVSNGDGVMEYAVNQGLARRGLGFGIARRVGDSTLRSAMLEHLERCSSIDYWLSAGPVPRPEWYPGASMDNVRVAIALQQASYCVDALGTAATDVAVRLLEDLHAAARGDARWQRGRVGGRILRFDMAISKAKRIDELGFRSFFTCCAADL